MKREAQEHSAEDKKRKEEIELRNQADNLVYSTEKQLKDLGDKIPADGKAKIEQAKEKLADAIKNNGDLRGTMDSLNQIWSEVSTQMYQNAGPAQEQPQTDAQAGQQQSNVEEADYTIVDDKN